MVLERNCFLTISVHGTQYQPRRGCTIGTSPQDPLQIPENVYHVHPSDGHSYVSMTPVFRHLNHHVWAHSMCCALGAKNKFNFLEGTVLVPLPFDPSYNAWSRCNMIILFLDHELGGRIHSSQTIVYLQNTILTKIINYNNIKTQ
jgi:hypothetical protein